MKNLNCYFKERFFFFFFKSHKTFTITFYKIRKGRIFLKSSKPIKFACCCSKQWLKKRKKRKRSGRHEYMDLNTYLTVLSENQESSAWTSSEQRSFTCGLGWELLSSEPGAETSGKRLLFSPETTCYSLGFFGHLCNKFFFSAKQPRQEFWRGEAIEVQVVEVQPCQGFSECFTAAVSRFLAEQDQCCQPTVQMGTVTPPGLRFPLSHQPRDPISFPASLGSGCNVTRLLRRPPGRSSDLFLFKEKLIAAQEGMWEASNEAGAPTGEVGTWKTNTSSNSIACHAELRERLLKSRLRSAERWETHSLLFVG